jgi:hypothetical protein
MKRFLLILCGLALLGATAPAPSASSSAAPSSAPTRIVDKAAAARLRANKGVTLQWLDWNTRGSARVTVAHGVWTLRAAQAQAGGPGRLFLEGRMTEVGRDYFLFDGTVRITDTPDVGRQCEKHDTWRFAVTQNRRYWRIRTFEWCDQLTDYVDIYF